MTPRDIERIKEMVDARIVPSGTALTILRDKLEAEFDQQEVLGDAKRYAWVIHQLQILETET